jgi:hypothetical protein
MSVVCAAAALMHTLVEQVMEMVAADPRVDITAKNLAGCSAIMWASSAGCARHSFVA